MAEPTLNAPVSQTAEEKRRGSGTKPVTPSIEKRVRATAKKVATPATKARREAPATTPQTRRAARTDIVVNDLKPYVHDQIQKQYKEQLGPGYTSLQDDDQANLVANSTQAYLSQLSSRATKLHPGLMRENPALAADLLLSGISTHKLPDASEAAFDAYRTQRGAWMRAHSSGTDLAPGLSPEVVAGLLQTHPELYQQAIAQGFSSTRAAQAGIPEGGQPEGESPLQTTVSGLGIALGAPFKFGGYVGSQALQATGAEGIAQDIGGGARWLEGEVGKGLHFAEGVTLTALTTPLSAWDIAHGHLPRYLMGWNEASDEGGPAAQVMNDILVAAGADPKDYQGFTSMAQFTVDIAGSEALLRLGGAIKAGRTVPGVRYTGEQWVHTEGRGLGKDIMDNVWDTIKDVAPEERAVIAHDTHPHMPVWMAQRLKDVITRDDLDRSIGSGIDEVPSIEIPKRVKELNAVKDELMTKPTAADLQLELEGLRAEGLVPTAELLDKAPVDAFGAMALQKAEGGALSTDYAALKADIAANGIKEPLVVRVNEDGTWNLMAGKHRLDIANELGIDNVPVKWVDDAGNVVPPPDVVVPEVASADIANLQGQRISLEQQITEMLNRTPVDRFPSVSRIRPFMRGIPQKTWLARTLQRFFGESGIGDLSTFTNDMSRQDARVVRPRRTGNPVDYMDRNFDALRKTMNAFKVPKDAQRGVLTELLDATSPQKFFWWRKSLGRVLEDGLSNYRGGRNIDLVPELRRQISKFSDQTVEEQITAPITVEATLADGTKVSQVVNALRGTEGQSIPIFSKDFIGDVALPDIGLAQEITSSIRYADNFFKSHPGMSSKAWRQLSTTADVAKFVALTVPRLVLRPALLVSRIIPMGLKILLDQGLRQRLMGYTRSVWKKNRVDFGPAGLPKNPSFTELLGPDQDLSALGMVASEMEGITESVTTRVSTRNLIPGSEEAVLAARSRADLLTDLSTDPLASKLAVYGPEGTLEFIRTHPESRLARKFNENQGPLWESQNITPEQGLAAGYAVLEQAAGGDPALLQAIGTRNWNLDRPVPTGAAIERGFVMDEIDAAKAQLAQTELGRPRQELQSRIDVLENRLNHADAADVRNNTLNLQDIDELHNEITQRWHEGRYQMPDEVLIRRRVAEEDLMAGATRLEKARAMAQKLNRQIYRPMRLLTKYDLTRRSTYVAVLERTYQDLVDKGYTPVESLDIARVRAAYITKDLHYDITARSSFDRRMQDYFWFSPVWREQMTTYLYKIPSQHYWPVGFTLRTFEAYSVIDTLQQFGLLSWDNWTAKDPKTGQIKTGREMVLNVPWISDFVGKIVGNEEAGKLKVGGLNPLTPGTSGVLPTLAPGAETILDMGARHAPASMRHFFAVGADLFTFDQDPTAGPSYIPTPLVAAMEIVGIHAPFDTLSLDAWREAERKANVQSIRWAGSDLAKDGILPPKFDYGFNDKQQAKYDAEVAIYKAKLIERSHYYERTLGILHVIGSAILPGRFTASTGLTDAGQAFYDFRDTLDPNLSTDDYFKAVDAYLGQHPAAYPYAAGAHPGKFGTPTYDSSKTIETNDFVDKALQQTVYWMDVKPEDAPAGEQAGLVEKQSQRTLVQQAAEPVRADLTPEVLDSLGIPDFEGRDTMVRKVNDIYETWDKQYRSENTDDRNALVTQVRDDALARLSDQFGKGAEQVLKFYRSTPAERLRAADYWNSQSSVPVLNEVSNISRHALAQGNSPGGFSAEAKASKIDLYREVERYRASDPSFDREMRRAELTLGEKDTTKGRVALYEWLFFNVSYNMFGYQDEIVRGLNG